MDWRWCLDEVRVWNDKVVGDIVEVDVGVESDGFL